MHLLILLASYAALGAASASISRVVSSNAGLRLASQPAVRWIQTEQCPHTALRLHLDQKYQTIGGFGASMTESSAINVNSLAAAKQTELLEALFGPTGARFSAMKATMLSNDFATATGVWATYDDNGGLPDTALSHFSIERDLKGNGTLAFIKRAIAAGFEGTVQSYMDFPPDWMLRGVGSQTNRSIDPQYYSTLAMYFAKYVEAYAEHGVHIDFVEAFNEPVDSYVNISAKGLATFLGKHLGPLFDKRGLRPRTKLSYGGQCARATALKFVEAVMKDPDARAYMDVIVYHGYDCQLAIADNPASECGDAAQNYNLVAEMKEKFGKERDLWMSEICYAYFPLGGDDACLRNETLRDCAEYPRNHSLAPPLPRRDFADGATWGHRIVREMQAGASGWIYWNLALDKDGGPSLISPGHGDPRENKQHPVVIVDLDSYHLTGLYFFLAHFSKFVRPGAVRVGLDESDALPPSVVAVAFLDAPEEEDAGVTLQLVNIAKGAAHTVAVCAEVNGSTWIANVTLPALSITTARWAEQRS